MSESCTLAPGSRPAAPRSFRLPIRIQPRTARIAALIAIAAVGVLLRFYWITAQSFWRNEFFSVFWVRHSWDFLWTDGMQAETNPPLYYTLLKLWIACFGDSVWAARSLSALASAVCIPLLYLLVQEIGERRAALPAAAVMAIAPSQIFFANETRGYALIPTLVTAALLFLFRYVRVAGETGRERTIYLAGYVLFSAALVYVHVSGLLVLGALGSAFVLFAAEAGLSRATLRPLVVATGLILLLALPEIRVAFVQQHSPNIDWIPELSAFLIAGSVRTSVFGPIAPWEYSLIAYDSSVWLEAGLTVSLLALVTVAARHSAVSRPHAMFFALTPVLFLVEVVGISLFRPILLPRVMIFSSVPLAILAGLTIAGPPPGARRLLAGRRAVVLALVLGSSAFGIATDIAFPAEPKPAWSRLVPELAARSQPGDLVVSGPHGGPLAMTFYGERRPVRGELRRWVVEKEVPTAASNLDDAVCGHCAIGSDALASAIRQGRPVWLALDTADQQIWRREQRCVSFPPPAERVGFPGLILLRWN